ncbi:MAG: hypothetical protein JXR89_05730 [Deltaproteobacteria bacterium]|nr:hypothetical protein [Deltaproteobacteria bacterium]
MKPIDGQGRQPAVVYEMPTLAAAGCLGGEAEEAQASQRMIIDVPHSL